MKARFFAWLFNTLVAWDRFVTYAPLYAAIVFVQRKFQIGLIAGMWLGFAFVKLGWDGNVIGAIALMVALIVAMHLTRRPLVEKSP